MEAACHRHDISDNLWEMLEPYVPGRKGTWGDNARDNRQFITAVFWILRTGAPWRDRGVWEDLLELLVNEPDYEWLMIDATHIKAPHAAGAKGGNQAMSRSKGGSTPRCIWPWMRMVCWSECLLQTVPTADRTQALKLIEGIDAEALLADRAYDTDEIIIQAEESGMEVVMPPKKNRKVQRQHDTDLYKLRHLVENAFLVLK